MDKASFFMNRMFTDYILIGRVWGSKPVLVNHREQISSYSSVVGSIGVIAASFGLHEAIGKLGIERRVLTAGKKKLMYDPFRPVNEADVAVIQNLLNEIHRNFKAHVEKNRGGRLVGDRDKLFSGEVWVGQQAVDLGLADGLHTVDSFIR